MDAAGWWRGAWPGGGGAPGGGDDGRLVSESVAARRGVSVPAGDGAASASSPARAGREGVITAAASSIAATSGDGSQAPGTCGCPDRATKSTTCWGVGRSAGFFAMQAATIRRSLSGTVVRSGSSCTTRRITSAAESPVNGGAPLAAKARVAPSENTSPAGVRSSPRACSGDMYAGVPSTVPVAVSRVPSAARAIPKSMT